MTESGCARRDGSGTGGAFSPGLLRADPRVIPPWDQQGSRSEWRRIWSGRRDAARRLDRERVWEPEPRRPPARGDRHAGGRPSLPARRRGSARLRERTWWRSTLWGAGASFRSSASSATRIPFQPVRNCWSISAKPARPRRAGVRRRRRSSGSGRTRTIWVYGKGWLEAGSPPWRSDGAWSRSRWPMRGGRSPARETIALPRASYPEMMLWSRRPSPRPRGRRAHWLEQQGKPRPRPDRHGDWARVPGAGTRVAAGSTAGSELSARVGALEPLLPAPGVTSRKPRKQ